MKTTVTIGIPAFNEENNIVFLIEDILRQNSNSHDVESIIIQCDGGKDNTASEVKKIRNNKIILFDHKDNKGVAYRQNQIIEMTKSEILIIINGDTRIRDSNFIEKLIAPIQNKEFDLVSPLLAPVSSKTFFEAVIVIGFRLRQLLFGSWRNGQNGYLCHGTARAFSKRFYTKFRFNQGGGEDMYSYLVCLSMGYKFQSIRDAEIYYRVPSSFQDHFKQSVRFFKFQTRLSESLDSKIVREELIIPIFVYIKGAIRAFPLVLRFPFHVFCYVILVTCLKIRSYLSVNKVDLWNATSTKAQV